MDQMEPKIRRKKRKYKAGGYRVDQREGAEESRKGLSERAKRIYCKRGRGMGSEYHTGGGSPAIAQLGGPQEVEAAVMEERMGVSGRLRSHLKGAPAPTALPK